MVDEMVASKVVVMVAWLVAKWAVQTAVHWVAEWALWMVATKAVQTVVCLVVTLELVMVD